MVGPTAIGKTALGIRLAQKFNSEIISADSRQFFKEMNIGTAVPSEEERNAAPHHFIQHISIEEEYSVGDFEREALKKSSALFQKHPILILVGGSGLYIKSLVEGLDDFPEVDPSIRENLNRELAENGLEPLQEQLKTLDPLQYKQTDIQNPHRVIRALEICLGTKKPYSLFLNRKKNTRDFEVISIGITAPRQEIYDRINKRVGLMMDAGLLDEVKSLQQKKHLNALNTVGYKELFLYLEGKTTLEDAVEEIKKNTRRFAKRQLTWFRKDKNTNWFDYRTPPEEIVEFIKAKIANS